MVQLFTGSPCVLSFDVINICHALPRSDDRKGAKVQLERKHNWRANHRVQSQTTYYQQIDHQSLHYCRQQRQQWTRQKTTRLVAVVLLRSLQLNNQFLCCPSCLFIWVFTKLSLSN